MFTYLTELQSLTILRRQSCMGAFLGYDEVGVWASNRERDAVLDWFASHRCVEGDARWDYCKSPAQRWMGRCIDIEDIIPRAERFLVTPAEKKHAPTNFGQLWHSCLESLATSRLATGPTSSAAENRLTGVSRMTFRLTVDAEVR